MRVNLQMEQDRRKHEQALEAAMEAQMAAVAAERERCRADAEREEQLREQVTGNIRKLVARNKELFVSAAQHASFAVVCMQV